jgi:hypothetical protein
MASMLSRCCGTNIEHIFLLCKYLSTICLAAFLRNLRNQYRSVKSLVNIGLTCITKTWVFSIFSLKRKKIDRPGWGPYISLTTWKRAKHQQTYVRMRQTSLLNVCLATILWNVFPALKQNWFTKATIYGGKHTLAVRAGNNLLRFYGAQKECHSLPVTEWTSLIKN